MKLAGKLRIVKAFFGSRLDIESFIANHHLAWDMQVFYSWPDYLTQARPTIVDDAITDVTTAVRFHLETKPDETSGQRGLRMNGARRTL